MGTTAFVAVAPIRTAGRRRFRVGGSAELAFAALLGAMVLKGLCSPVAAEAVTTYYPFWNTGTTLTQPSVTTNTTCPVAADVNMGTVNGIALMTSTDASQDAACQPATNRDLIWAASAGTKSCSFYFNGDLSVSSVTGQSVSVAFRNDSGTAVTVTVKLFYTRSDNTKVYFTGSATQSVAGGGARTNYSINLTSLAASSIPSGSKLGLEYSWTNSGSTFRIHVNSTDGSNDQLVVSDAPTAVKLVSFDAVAYGDGTLLQWRTGHEADNLGFNVYREEGGQRILLTPQVLAGSALLAGSDVVLRAGQPYAWWDDTPRGVGSPVYHLEDIDLDGTRTLHGPVAPVAGLGRKPIVERAATLVRLSGAMAHGRGGASALSPGRSAGSAVRGGPVAVAPGLTPEQAQQVLAGSPAVKIFIREEGWYRVTQPELAAWGLGGADPRRLQLYVEGTQVPIVVQGEGDGVFDPQDCVEFYAQGIDTPSTDARACWLVAGTAKGLRVRAAAEGIGGVAPSGFADTAAARPRVIYSPALPRSSGGDRFYGPMITNDPGAPAVVTLLLGPADAANPVTAALEVSLQGMLLQRHDVAVLLNDAPVGHVLFADKNPGRAALEIDPALLRAGANELRLTALGAAADFILFDAVRLTYQRAYAAAGDALRFTASGGEDVTIGGFSAPTVTVVDVTDPRDVRIVGTAVVDVDGGCAVSFNAPGAGVRTLLAFTEGRVLRPAAITGNRPSSWGARGNRADLVVVAHRDLMAALAPLVRLRQRQGLAVALVDVEDLYDEFAFGTKAPEAIREFLALASSTWARRPRFVLLAGDASLDPRDYIGFGGDDLVPTNFVDAVYAEAVSDDRFADFDGDGLPELAVGRIPARTAEEAAAVVAKIVGYEETPGGAWAKRATVVADVDAGDDTFTMGCGQLASLFPAEVTVEKVCRGGYASGELAKLDLLNAVEEGTTIVDYMGHGSVDAWAGNLLASADADTMVNAPRLPFFVSMTCRNGWFTFPFYPSLAESLLNAEQGGAVAVWASSTLTEPAGQLAMNKELVRLLGRGALTLGEAAARAKAATDDMDVRNSWVFFGDPTTRLKW